MKTLVGLYPLGCLLLSCMLGSVMIATNPGMSAVAQDVVLHAKDLISMARALLANGSQAKAYLGRKFEADGKFVIGLSEIPGSSPVEIEFSDFVVVGRLRSADEVHVVCSYASDDPALKSVRDIVAHQVPVSLSGTVARAYESDSEGIIVAFVELKDCNVVKKSF